MPIAEGPRDPRLDSEHLVRTRITIAWELSELSGGTLGRAQIYDRLLNKFPHLQGVVKQVMELAGFAFVDKGRNIEVYGPQVKIEFQWLLDRMAKQNYNELSNGQRLAWGESLSERKPSDVIKQISEPTHHDVAGLLQQIELWREAETSRRSA